MNKYIEMIGIDDELKERLTAYYSKNKSKTEALAKECKSKGFGVLNHRSHITRLAVCTQYLMYTEQRYKELGIDKSILEATAKDIGIWCKNNGNKGLKNHMWIQNHLKAELFKLGRLQFQLFKCNNPTLPYSKLPFQKGDSLIYIHIPQGEKLRLSECKDSIRQANEFFAKYFPCHKYSCYLCESWLLYDKNKEFMDADSNIIQFQSLFDINVSLPIDAQAIERIYGKRRLNKRNYPQNTHLQKSAKEYMLGGGRLGIGIGTINKDEIE